MPLPEKWRGFFVGRKVIHPETPGLEGVVKYATMTRMGKLVPAGTGKPTIESQFLVEWDNGEQQLMEDTDVATIATDEFIKEDWVHEKILKLQACGWDEAKAAAMKSKPVTKPRTTGVTSAPPKALRAPTPSADRAGPSTAPEPKKRKAKSVSEPPAKKTTTAAAKAAGPAPSAANGNVAPAPAAAAKPKAPKKKASRKAEPSGSAIVGSPDRAQTRAAAAPTSPRQVAFPGASARAAPPRPKTISSPFLHVDDLTHVKVRGKYVYEYDLLTVGGTSYRVYCRDIIVEESLSFRPRGTPADMTVDTWKIQNDPEDDQEFEVDYIVAERQVRQKGSKKGSKGETMYLIKWTGYELDLGSDSWMDFDGVNELAQYDTWLKHGRKKWRAGVRAVHTAAGLEG